MAKELGDVLDKPYAARFERLDEPAWPGSRHRYATMICRVGSRPYHVREEPK
jgi:hypothetical protein